MEIETYFVDSFTSEAFKGNPAGVCILSSPISAEVMQQIASEINFSETAFIQANDSNTYSIRYFTPEVEIDFCGHATLASAKVLLEKYKSKDVHFITYKNLQLSAQQLNSEIEMRFPLYETLEHSAKKNLLDAFGIDQPLAIHYSSPLDLLLIEVESKEQLKNLTPDFTAILKSSNDYKECVITTKSEDAVYDFYSRCFCPWLGINEDPVTGAVHSSLATYWSKKLKKNNLKAFQLSNRGGYLNLQVVNNESLLVTSNAVITLKGNFIV